MFTLCLSGPSSGECLPKISMQDLALYPTFSLNEDARKSCIV